MSAVSVPARLSPTTDFAPVMYGGSVVPSDSDQNRGCAPINAHVIGTPSRVN